MRHLTQMIFCSWLTWVCPAAMADGTTGYVGTAACITCHEPEAAAWQGSHHDLAMQAASRATILAPFGGESHDYEGLAFRFRMVGDRGVVEISSDGESLEQFDVSETFGAVPLQQYLVNFPGGRKQVLPVAWDSRPAAAGGQRWFLPLGHMTPEQRPDWRGWQYNWNTTCAECHSTHLEKNYDPDSHRFETTFSDPDVGCEACHGPGEGHLAWVQAAADAGNEGLSSDPLKGLTHRLGLAARQWQPHPDTGVPRAAEEGPGESVDRQAAELDTCGACHARRLQLFEDDRIGQPLHENFLPVHLEQALYETDGQILDEVFVYGSLVQSRMFEAGITCTDCHEPHSLALKADGNRLCLTCHGPDYNTEAHHFHPEGPGSQCVNCHMPARTYMGVDERRDHSFRIPDPLLSREIGVPSTCDSCHEDAVVHGKLPDLKIGDQRYRPYARALHASRNGHESALAQVQALLDHGNLPDIHRATLVAELPRLLTPGSLPLLADALGHDSPLVRAAAIAASADLPERLRWQLLWPLLDDPSQMVRSLVGGRLANVPVNNLAEGDAAKLSKAWQLFLAAQAFNSDTPGARTNLGNFMVEQGRIEPAETYYRSSIERFPGWIPAYLNLADLYRQTGRDAEGQELLRQAIAIEPGSAEAHHSLGLLKVRQQKMDEALTHLARSVALRPGSSRYVYVYAVALNSTGQRQEALALLDQVISTSGGSPELRQLRQQLKREP